MHLFFTLRGGASVCARAVCVCACVDFFAKEMESAQRRGGFLEKEGEQQ